MRGQGPQDAEAAAAAIAALEEFQVEQYRNLGIPLPEPVEQQLTPEQVQSVMPQFSHDQSRRVLEWIGEGADVGQSVPGSRYDSPLERAFLHSIGRELEEVVPPDIVFPMPIYGMSPLWPPNAKVTVHLPSARPIIVVQRGLCAFFMQALRALVHASKIQRSLRECSDDELSYSLEWENTREFDQSLSWLTAATLSALTGRPGEANTIATTVHGNLGSSFDVPPIEFEVSTQLLNSVMGFVLAHEFGHAIETLNPSERVTFGSLKDQGISDEDFAEIMHNMWEEGAADYRGIILSVKRAALVGLGPELAYLGATLFLDLMLLLEECMHLLRDGHAPIPAAMVTLTHPPLLSRRDQVEDVISKINGNPRDTARGRLVAQSFSDLIARFRQYSHPVFLNFHHNGIPEFLLPEYRE
ncbi:hypothetical protein [Bradyrhizobium diazoefficiens]